MIIPVALFAYARPAHLARVLACLRANAVPSIEAFADGAKGTADAPAVDATRALLRAVDWCELRLHERPANLGLGANVLAGVTDLAARHQSFMVWEDDLVCVPGTYAWMCAALERYRDEESVMSVTAWTHPRVTPRNVGAEPWFDRRAECWVWGTWSRSWAGMPQETATEKIAALAAKNVRPNVFGDDLPVMAAQECEKNIWAVRWLYHHLQHDGLCVRPPWSMVEHIGFDATATNAETATAWVNPPLRPAPPIPSVWPQPVAHPASRGLWLNATGTGWRRWWRRARAILKSS